MLAGSIDEMKEAFRLIYDRYLASGFQEPDPSLMRIGFHNLLPTSNLIIVKRNGKVAGTLTIIGEFNGKLPIDALFGEEIDKIRGKDSMICELSGLATDAVLSRRESSDILLSLFKSTFILGHDILGCTDFCMMINPHHSAYYKKDFNCENIGKVKHCEKVNGAPAVPLRLNTITGEEVFQKNNPQLYRYFTVNDRRNIIERLSHELHNQRKLYSTEFISSLVRSKSNLLKTLTEEEKNILCCYYSELREVV